MQIRHGDCRHECWPARHPSAGAWLPIGPPFRNSERHLAYGGPLSAFCCQGARTRSHPVRRRMGGRDFGGTWDNGKDLRLEAAAAIKANTIVAGIDPVAIGEAGMTGTCHDEWMRSQRSVESRRSHGTPRTFLALLQADLGSRNHGASSHRCRVGSTFRSAGCFSRMFVTAVRILKYTRVIQLLCHHQTRPAVQSGWR